MNDQRWYRGHTNCFIIVFCFVNKNSFIAPWIEMFSTDTYSASFVTLGTFEKNLGLLKNA